VKKYIQDGDQTKPSKGQSKAIKSRQQKHKSLQSSSQAQITQTSTRALGASVTTTFG